MSGRSSEPLRAALKWTLGAVSVPGVLRKQLWDCGWGFGDCQSHPALAVHGWACWWLPLLCWWLPSDVDMPLGSCWVILKSNLWEVSKKRKPRVHWMNEWANKWVNERRGCVRAAATEAWAWPVKNDLVPAAWTEHFSSDLVESCGQTISEILSLKFLVVREAYWEIAWAFVVRTSVV